MTFPTAAGALAIVFNIPKIAQINLTASSIADIFMGKIVYWNHTAIQSVNPTVELPKKEIQLVARADVGAGDTVIFTSALSSISQSWNKSYGTFMNPEFVDGDCCNSTKWPSHIAFYGSRATGVIGVVASIPYTLGYTSWSNTMGTGISVARIINSNGTLVEANSTEAVKSAMNYFLKSASHDTRAGLEFDISSAKSADAYPFSLFSYMIVNRTTHPNVSACQMEELVGFVAWLFSPTIAGMIPKYGLVPLSQQVTDRIIQSVLPQITYQGRSVYSDYVTSLIHPDTSTSFSTNMVIAGTVMLSAMVVLAAAVVVLYYRKNKINDTLWLLSGVKVVRQDDFLKSKLNPTTSMTFSISTDTTTPSDTKSFLAEGIWEPSESSVFMTMVDLKRGSNWNSKIKSTLSRFSREISHANVLQFLGVTVIDAKIYFVNQHCFAKGTLHYVLKTCPFPINDSIKTNVASDILDGLRYLHQRNIFHGTLNSLECYVDVAWCVKIAHWEHGTVYTVDENDTHCTNLLIKSNECDTSLASMETLIKLLYLDPDYFQDYSKPTAAMDVFSYGMLLVEIFTRNLPYAQEVELELNSYSDIIRDKFSAKQFPLPMNLADVPIKVLDMIHKTLAVNPRLMDINTLHKCMKQMAGNRKSVVDILMQSMEKYMNELEEKVNDSATELSMVTDRMKDLLQDVLPKQIAHKLINGQVVKPEFYECCTILFTDVVGFTKIAATSTPTQVIYFLNSLFTVFDQTAEQFDVYKVDTIGDSCMAASGVPTRNGIDHCKQIGQFALALMDKGRLYKIPHLPNDSLQLRMGVNSGPVTTGIIGNKMPRFSIFGDTVSMAFKMQTSSLPNRIHVSQTTHDLFANYFPKFLLESRGEIEIKGKGKVNTFWLLPCS